MLQLTRAFMRGRASFEAASRRLRTKAMGGGRFRRWTRATHRLHPIPVERGLLALAVNLERALVPDRVRTLKNPVLPGSEAAEHARGQSLGAVEAQVRFH